MPTLTKPNKAFDPTRLGVIEDIAGPSLRVKLGDETATGLIFHKGEGYRIGQVGSFVKIPAGYTNLYGLVTQVGAGAAPIQADGSQAYGNKWLKIELVGEGRSDKKFERGISKYPSIGDVAYIVTESDLASIYAPEDKLSYVSVGSVASAESIPAYLNLNKLVTRHSAVVGSTGAGKSTSVASLLNSLADQKLYPAARIILFDLHGEYGESFGDAARVFRINADEARGEKSLYVPYWALNSEELVNLSSPAAGAQLATLLENITAMKRQSKPAGKSLAMATEDITADTPVPFSIHKIWHDVHCDAYSTHTANESGQSEATRAFEVNAAGQPEQGDALKLIRPKFRPATQAAGETKIYKSSPQQQNMRSYADMLESKLRDPRLQFLFNPGNWAVNENNETVSDLDELLDGWAGKEKPITVFDLSGVPSVILDDLVGAILRIIYDSMFWGRAISAGGRNRPLLLVLEEAHTYLGTHANSATKNRASLAAKRIAKEGRKYGVGLMLVSQRPSEIDSTILSQCGTMIAMRLTNDSDRGQIKSCASDNLDGLFGMLPTLRTGEALIIGEAVGLPIRALIKAPSSKKRPNSHDPAVVASPDEAGKRTGGWTESVADENFSALVECWRANDIHKSTKIKAKTTKPKGA